MPESDTPPGASPASDTPTYPMVEVRLTGHDGNANVIIARVARALGREVGTEAAESFTRAARACTSYDQLLRLTMSTVTVS